MGDLNIVQGTDPEKLGEFIHYVLLDLMSLEQMLCSGKIESGIRRIGAEQEMFLIDRYGQPAPVADGVLKSTSEPGLTSELARFNLEANTTPLELTGSCLSDLESELDSLVSAAQKAASQFEAQVLLTGILPTLTLSDLNLSNLMDQPRYFELNRALTQMRGSDFYVHIKGIDEMHLNHDNMMLEACNTSFQIHFQCDPHRFADQYNVAQLITAPVLAAAVNSPLLFGKRLWSETRLALFQHSVDERSPVQKARHHPSRVSFGEHWVQKSVLEILREDIARFRVLLTRPVEEDSQDILAKGGVPALSSLRLHNGTVWRWNRPCYGVLNGVPNLRIENRVLPAGPTVKDEVANAAFFLGLMNSLLEEYGPVSRLMEFQIAQANFYSAARHGLHAQFTWIDGQIHPARELILQHLLPLARQGLSLARVNSADVERYLGILEERVRSGQTGAEWTLKSLASLKKYRGTAVQCRALTQAMLAKQQEGDPVHHWALASESSADWHIGCQKVSNIMSTDLYTVRPYDLVNLAASIMDWEQIRHVPVEDDEGKLVGLVSHRDLLKLLAQSASIDRSASVPVHMIMKREVLTVDPDAPVLDALKKMRENKVGCLPVVRAEKLVGIITVYDFLALSVSLLEEELKR